MYPRAHTLITWLGDAYGQQEEWQVGLRLDGTDLPTDAEFEALDQAMETMLGTAGTYLPQGRRYIGIKAAPIAPNGKYPPDGESREWLRPTPYAANVGDGYPQIALVLSLRTARTRGYASNGRMYLPSGLTVSTSTGLIALDVAEDAAAAGAAFIGAVRDVDLGVPSVMSSVGAGRIEAITGVRVGRVMDTQRRRRNSLPESFTAASPVPL